MYNFSYKSYSALLQQFLLRGYLSTSYTRFNSSQRGQLLLRHDIDIDLQSCNNIFEIEVAHGLHATWFIQPNNDMYNPLSSEALKIFTSIARYHSLGLHIDPWFAQDAKDLEAYINKAYNFYSNYLPLEPVLSYHRPAKFLKNSTLDLTITGFVNAYSDSFVKDFFYFSDSNRRCFWEEERFQDALSTSCSVNLLVHPVWWGEISLPPERVLERLELRVKRMARKVLSNNVTCFEEILKQDAF